MFKSETYICLQVRIAVRDNMHVTVTRCCRHHPPHAKADKVKYACCNHTQVLTQHRMLLNKVLLVTTQHWMYTS